MHGDAAAGAEGGEADGALGFLGADAGADDQAFRSRISSAASTRRSRVSMLMTRTP